MKVVGVDGCKCGWVAVIWDVVEGHVLPEIHLTLKGLIAAHGDAATIGSRFQLA